MVADPYETTNQGVTGFTPADDRGTDSRNTACAVPHAVAGCLVEAGTSDGEQGRAGGGLETRGSRPRGAPSRAGCACPSAPSPSVGGGDGTVIHERGPISFFNRPGEATPGGFLLLGRYRGAL